MNGDDDDGPSEMLVAQHHKEDVRQFLNENLDQLLKNQRAIINERVLVSTLTKRMSEDLTEYLEEQGVKVKYLHSDIKTIERTVILRDLRKKKYDCIVGVNLLREGIDLPEVSLVAIFDDNII